MPKKKKDKAVSETSFPETKALTVSTRSQTLAVSPQPAKSPAVPQQPLYSCPCQKSQFLSKTAFLKAIKEQELDRNGRCPICNSLVVDSSQPRCLTPQDYAMSKVPQTYLLENAEPISVVKPQSWADIVETTDAQLEDAQPHDDAPWTDSEFKNWCRLMGLPDTMSMAAGNQKQIHQQYLVYDKFSKTFSKTNVAAQGSTSSSVVGPSRPTQKSIMGKNPISHHTSTVQSVPKQTLSSGVSQPIFSKGPSLSEEPSFFKNERVYPLTQIEPNFWHSNPQEVAKLILSPQTNFLQKTLAHTQKFYEFILTDTKSCLFRPHMDKQTQSFVTHTSVWIKKIISPSEWGIHPSKYKRLSQSFEPQIFNYYDYQDAWLNTFTFQNPPGKHSWFILWDKQFASEFPQWFLHQWWPIYGPHLDILPPPVQDGFNYFCNRFHSPLQIPPFLQFAYRFHIPWIYSQKFAFHKPDNQKTGLPWLALQGHSKWYKNWDPKEAYIPSVEKWFDSHPEYLSPTDTAQYTFLQQKSIAAAQLAKSSSKGEFIHQMEQLLQQLKDEPIGQPSHSSSPTEPGSEEEEHDDASIASS
jgi:hypothetical protein